MPIHQLIKTVETKLTRPMYVTDPLGYFQFENQTEGWIKTPHELQNIKKWPLILNFCRTFSQPNQGNQKIVNTVKVDQDDPQQGSCP